MRSTRTLWQSTAGVTAIEYAMIASLIAVSVITAVAAIGPDLRDTFNAVAAAFGETVDGGGGSDKECAQAHMDCGRN